MATPVFSRAIIHDDRIRVELIINGKRVEINDIPASNEIIAELTKLFKRHLPKVEDF